jgi:hypothetical protein
VVDPVLIDQLNLGIADIVIGARPILGGDGRGSVGTANGCFSSIVNEGRSVKETASAGKHCRVLRGKTLATRHFGHAAVAVPTHVALT